MKQLQANGDSRRTRHAGQSGSVRIIVLSLACFVAGAIVGAFCLLCSTSRTQANTAAAPSLSDVTKDLTPAIARVAAPAPPARPAPRADVASLDAVRRALPNLKTISLEEGTQTLRTAALAEFQKAALNMQAELDKAQQDFQHAQNNQSEAQQQAVLKRIKEIQAEQTAKLKQIAANSRAQIVALQQIKKEAQ